MLFEFFSIMTVKLPTTMRVETKVENESWDELEIGRAHV